MFSDQEKKRYVKTIAVASGKGGVGKTNVAANLAVSFRMLGKKVMIVDADLGRSNIDALLHLAPHYNIQHLLSGGMQLKDVLVEGPLGIQVLSAGSGVQELTSLDEYQQMKILEAFDAYESDVDVLLIDTAAGISENVAFFCSAAQEIIIVTSPEPTAISGAYALVKVLYTRYREKEFSVLVNSARNSAEAFDVFQRLSLSAEKFLSISLDYLGYLPFDGSVQDAVRAQRAFVEAYPDCTVSKHVRDIARNILEHTDRIKGSLQFFISNVLSASSDSAH